MKQLLLVLASVICICYTTNTFAQSKILDKDIEITADQIIIDDKDNEGLTTIEIKNGKLFIDGKKVSDLKDNAHIKIIKKNTTSDKHDFKFDFDRMDSPFRSEQRRFGNISRKAMLGVQTQDANPGAEVKQVVEGSAAEKAGIQEGDIIVGVDAENIENSQDLAKRIGQYKKGDEVTIQIERNGRSDNLLAQLDAPELMGTPFESLPEIGNQTSPWKNLEEMFNMPGGSMRVFSSNSAKPSLGIEVEESGDGIEILSVKPNSAAEKAGIQVGDEIKTIEGEEVNTIADLTSEIMRNKSNKKMYIGVKRAGAIKTLPLVLPRAKKRAQF